MTYQGFTPAGFAEALSKFGADLRPTVAKSLRSASYAVRATYVSMAVEHGMLKTVFGKNAKGLYGLVRTKVFDKGTSFVLALELKGMAGLQEAGGHTKPPRKGAIFPHAGTKALAMKVGGSIVFAASAKHRGAQVARFPVGTRALLYRQDRVAAGLDLAIKKALAQRGIEAA